MFRDFHVIEGENDSYLFFPETFKFYAVSMEDGKTLRRFLNEGTAIRNELEAILINEEKKVSVEMQPVNAEADSLCLYMAHDCNLFCTYCYNKGGRIANPLMMMTEETVEAAFRGFFIKPGKTYAVSFYGGEPLLNFKTIKKAVEMGEALKRELGINISYSITTNGTILNDEIITFLDKHFSVVTVSLDGPKEVNDLHRKPGYRAGGYSTYEKVLRNIKKLKEKTGIKVTIKATLTGNGVRLFEESLKHLHGLGVDGVVMTPVNVSNDNPAYISDLQYKDFVQKYTELSRLYLDELTEARGQGFEYTFNIIFSLLTKRRFLKHCDAGKNPAITADGSIYACHGLVGIKDFYMGKVTENEGIGFQRIKEIFAGLNVDAIDECKTCWARYLCGGSCYAHAYFNTGTPYKPDPRHCLLFKRNAEVVILEFLKAMEDPVKRDDLYRGIKGVVNTGERAPYG